MTANIKLQKKVYITQSEITLEMALLELGLFPESYLAVRNGELIEKNQLLKDGDEIKLVAAISGGAGTFIAPI